MILKSSTFEECKVVETLKHWPLSIYKLPALPVALLPSQIYLVSRLTSCVFLLIWAWTLMFGLLATQAALTEAMAYKICGSRIWQDTKQTVKIVENHGCLVEGPIRWHYKYITDDAIFLLNSQIRHKWIKGKNMSGLFVSIKSLALQPIEEEWHTLKTHFYTVECENVNHLFMEEGTSKHVTNRQSCVVPICVEM